MVGEQVPLALGIPRGERRGISRARVSGRSFKLDGRVNQKDIELDGITCQWGRSTKTFRRNTSRIQKNDDYLPENLNIPYIYNHEPYWIVRKWVVAAQADVEC